MISKRLLEVAVVSAVDAPVLSKSPVVAGYEGPASISKRFISFTGSSAFSSFFSFSSSLLSSFFADDIPANKADFIFSFFSSTTGFSGSFFFVLVMLSCLLGIDTSVAGFDDLSSSGSGASLPQTCLLFVTRSYKLSFASDELYVTLTGANPEVLSTGADGFLLTSLVLLKIGYYYS